MHNNLSRKITFRMTEEEYAQLEQQANSLGQKVSSYIRGRVTHAPERVFYDPEMTDAVRGLRGHVRTVAQQVAEIGRAVHARDGAAREELIQVRALLRSVYDSVERVEQTLSRFKKELT